MANEKEVKAQVKLRFFAANRTRMLAIRSLSVTMTKTKMAMKTLEGVLSTSDGVKDNNKVGADTALIKINRTHSISSKARSHIHKMCRT
jgi:hypothetical protein